MQGDANDSVPVPSAHQADIAGSEKLTGEATGRKIPLTTPYPGTPRWVKVFVVAIVVLGLLVAVILFLGGHTSPVQHGP